MSKEIRWKQRFQNFKQAFFRLEKALEELKKNDNELIQAGVIKTYEFTFELAWKTLKDYLEYEGFDVPSPKKTIKQAFRSGYIREGQLWLDALDGRNKTSHVYGKEMAGEVLHEIRDIYFYIIRDLYFFFDNEA